MSNETINVPREILQTIVSVHPSDRDYRIAKEELRALLAQPAELRQGEPVAKVEVLDGGGQLWIALNAQWLPVGVHNLYTRPGAQSVPAAVVLPERKPEPSVLTEIDDDRDAAIWNACIDEVARLNPQQ